MLTRLGWTLAALLFAAGVASAQFAPVGPWVQGGRLPSPCGVNTLGQITKWNPSDKNAAISLSNSNFTASYSGSQLGAMGRAISSNKHSGKWYFFAHIDSRGDVTGAMIGIANASGSLNNNPANSGAGCYPGNWNSSLTPFSHVAANPFGSYPIIAVDLDHNTAWCGQLDVTCSVIPLDWSGPSALNGNPATNTNGGNISVINDGVSVMPAWGGESASGLNQVTLYTNTPVNDSTLAGFKYWDQP